MISSVFPFRTCGPLESPSPVSRFRCALARELSARYQRFSRSHPLSRQGFDELDVNEPRIRTHCTLRNLLYPF